MSRTDQLGFKIFSCASAGTKFSWCPPGLVVPNRSSPPPSRPRAEPGPAAALELPGSRRPRESSRAGGTGKAAPRPSPSSAGSWCQRSERFPRPAKASARPVPGTRLLSPRNSETRAALAAAAGGGRVHRDPGGGREDGRGRAGRRG